MSEAKLPIVLLAPEIFGTYGGVQSYMQRLHTIVGEYSKERGVGALSFSLAPGKKAAQSPDREILSANGSKLRLVYLTIQHLSRIRAGTAIVGHAGLVPLARFLKSVGLIRKYVLVLHGIESWCRFGIVDRYAARLASRIVATTEYTATEFALLNGTDRKRNVIIPLAAGRDLSGVFMDKEPGSPVRVTTVARLSRSDAYKGVDSLITAMSIVARRRKNLALTVAGQGDDLPRLRELSSSLGINSIVQFASGLSDEELDELYRRSDVFALPSKKEGFGIVFLEAMQYGLPCVGGNHGGIPEVIDHCRTGFLVEHGDSDSLAHYLGVLIDKPQLRTRLGANGRLKLQQRYTLKQMQEAWFALLDSL